MRVAFCWDWEPELKTGQTMTWEDGLMAALVELRNRGHEVEVFMPHDHDYIIPHPHFAIRVFSDVAKGISDYKPDVILHWADTTRKSAEPTSKLGIPMALCFAGGEANGGSERYMQHIFVESEVYKPGFMRKGIPVSTAFGTNTDLFKPIPEQPKYFDTIFPATFALWKRHNLYAQATKGLRSLACGYIYTDHEQECWQGCLDNGVMIMPHVSARELQYLYAASKVCVIPSQSNGGSQRTVLEAMAMNIPVVVCDSDKFDFAEGKVFKAHPAVPDLKVMVNMALDSEVSTRDYVVNNWSHIQYADALEKELYGII